MEQYQFRQCTWEECRFRFPVEVDQQRSLRCPTCGSDTIQVGEPVRTHAEQDGSWIHPTFEGLLDNIRSVHNVGSMFRTADGAGVTRLHLCGITATPANIKLAKAALGAQERVAWTHSLNGLDKATSLKKRGYQLWALETTREATPFFTSEPTLPHSRVAIIVGNEAAGVDPEILQICDQIYSLPMSGVKKSLNVAVSFGIAAYYLCFARNIQPEK